MFKYSPINSYALRNIQQNQIFFNNPLNFNDPFDTFHPANIKELSNENFVEKFCNSSKRNYDKKDLLGILNNSISRQDFYKFCDEHIDYILDFNGKNGIFKDKNDFLEKLNNLENSEINFVEDIRAFFSTIKLRIQTKIQETLNNIRKESLSKIGVSCFSKNNLNLLMWSHYADSHQGFCLEFDSNVEPFSKAFEVTYKPEIPQINSNILMSEKIGLESLQKFLSFKSIDWEHEEELRLIHQESNKSYGYNYKSLKAIYFGIRANQSDIEIICSIIKSQNPTVKLYKMKKLEKKFGIEPEEFFYSTAIEVQSDIILNIRKKFQKNEFTSNEIKELINNITEIQLKAHLEDLVNNNILTKNNNKYQLNK
ncbi:DUF2971 domain-containing protein [Polaribacter sp. R2A056_3_33]|uniref:DUF2971 domain-containing protein n=1 Tax=unclassified Polaribacter TaxID=196858 RepID=UPI001C4FC2BC|nr:DUF2971 domain-containing protein [Polaribacter sp. R2A056_3_33]QXP70178.1 DUF2971 domain-containing protein [Polaribacter sp. R2A056_3_33]